MNSYNYIIENLKNNCEEYFNKINQNEKIKNYFNKFNSMFDKKITLNQKSQFQFIKTIIKDNIWYYKDRLNTSRGPCDLKTLRICWINGIIDQNTFVWGPGLDNWIPIKNVRCLISCIRTPEGKIFYYSANINEN
mmetsp:Transcript_30307/g.42257  ORF Transcript_30307/g.42257 Transcript_30307/m.42257 type:complete len:135 (+) Transcript_30307:1946-2350(+)